jgi:hypothetical protein
MSEAEKTPQTVAGELESAAGQVSERFLGAIQQIADECARRGIRFIIANQQKRSDILEPEQLAGVTMEDELELIDAKLAAGEPLDKQAQRLFVHTRLMRDLKAWAASAGLPFVDVISAMDQERDNLLTHVHLSRRGNEIVARQLSAAILDGLPGATRDDTGAAAMAGPDT